MAHTICLITTTRSEYGLLRWIMQEVKDDPRLRLKIIATGMHLLPKFGSTYREIEKDGFKIDVKVHVPMDSDKDMDLIETIALGTTRLAKALEKMKPDFVVVMGDRYELLSILSACTILQIPIAHISGGELTEGAFDNQIRHAMTKASHLHFVANKTYADRVKQMGEEEWRVVVSGEPGLDNIHRLKFMDQKSLSRNLGLDLSKETALVTFHPVTLERDRIGYQLDQLFKAMEKAGMQYVITYPNSDPGNERIRTRIEKFVRSYKGGARGFISLGQLRYLSVLKHACMMIGNSSSGIVEAPSFNLPTVNIGTRQKGRVFAGNVYQTGYAAESILKGINAAHTYNKPSCVNPYGTGHSSRIVKDYIKKTLRQKSRDEILRKKFRDL